MTDGTGFFHQEQLKYCTWFKEEVYFLAEKVFSVSEINREINEALKKQFSLWNCWVTGEISNFKDHIPSGHWYFTVKDREASLRAVMFKTRTLATGFKPQNGMKVLIRGSVRIYERDGSVQLYSEEIYPSGVGALYLAYEQLKNKLAAEGLFAMERKKPLPRYPARVAIITSPTGAALRDIMNIARRRNPLISLVVVPAAVQGETAPGEIARAIGKVNKYGNLDLLIVSRGGGSLEELWAFNTEEVARAIANSAIPVVSAVGHEIDYTIADFVADLRAPTPSAAAELTIPVLQDLQASLSAYEEKLKRVTGALIEKKRKQIKELMLDQALARTSWRLVQSRQDLDNLCCRLQEGITGFITKRDGILKLLSTQLDLLSPLKILGRGYALAYNSGGEVINSVHKVREGEQLSLRLKDGIVDCAVKKLRQSGEGNAQTG